jgi:uncharacterized protein with ParB-like and HNH nuclease domain
MSRAEAPIITKDTTLAKFLTSERAQFRIPVYQRAYAWGRPGHPDSNERLEGFLKAVEELAEYDDGRGKFFGFLVSVPQGRFGHQARDNFYYIIDGQQRLTSLSLTYLVVATRLDELAKTSGLSEDLKKLITKEAKSVRSSFLFFDEELEENAELVPEVAMRLRPRYGIDLDSYRGLLSGRRNDSISETSIGNGYNIIAEYIKKFVSSKMEDAELTAGDASVSFEHGLLVKFLGALSRLHIAELEVIDSRLGAHSIFESINFAGEKLKGFDLIRNLAIEYFSEPGRAESVYLRTWKLMEDEYEKAYGSKGYEDKLQSFIYNYLRMLKADAANVSTSNVFEVFSDHYLGEDRSRRLTEQQVREIIGWSAIFLRLDSPAYDVRPEFLEIIPEDFRPCVKLGEEMSEDLADFKELKIDVTMPLLMEVLKTPKGSGCPFKDVLNFSSNFFVRYLLSGGSTKSLWKSFARVISRYRANGPKPDTLAGDWLRNNLIKIVRNKPEFLYPGDDAIKNNVKTAPVYDRCPNVVKYVLLKLDKIKQGRNFDAVAVRDYQIDHIMSQSITDPLREYQFCEFHDFLNCRGDLESRHGEYVHRLGNLVLSQVNQEMSNLTFPKRNEQKFYENSALLYTRELALNSKYRTIWNFDAIELRTNNLIQDILVNFP